MPFTFSPCKIPEVILVEPRTFGDDRGFFRETYKASEFAVGGISEKFVQQNFSHSIKNTLRGLHFQKNPRAQGKLVAAQNGEIVDVAVDIREGSPTYGKWVAETLSRENGRMLYVPAGFAHGFAVLSDTADVFYMITDEYSPEHDSGIAWNDPDIAVEWPIDSPLLSDKDQTLLTLKETGTIFTYEAS